MLKSKKTDATETTIDQVENPLAFDNALSISSIAKNDPVSNVVMNTWRGELCDCAYYPICCFAWFFPCIIWSQAYHKLYGNRGTSHAFYGYLAILIGFSVLYGLGFLFDTISPAVGGGFMLVANIAGVIVLLSLVKRTREVYQIKGNCCKDRCRCTNCNDGYADCCEVIWCQCCKTVQLGHHLFDYTNPTNTAVTYEPIPGSYNDV